MEQIDRDRLAHGLKNYDPNLLPRRCPPKIVGLRPEQQQICTMFPGFASSLRVGNSTGRYCVSYTGYGAHGTPRGCVTPPLPLQTRRAPMCRPKAHYVLGHTGKSGVRFVAPKVLGFPLYPRLVKRGATLLEVRP